MTHLLIPRRMGEEKVVFMKGNTIGNIVTSERSLAGVQVQAEAIMR